MLLLSPCPCISISISISHGALPSSDSTLYHSDTTGPYNCGIDPASLSGFHNFEGVDPAEWVHRGYAVINIDARGSYNSEGNMMRWGPQEAKDVHDTVKWISEQSWCNGNVGMS